jgi:maltose O-acetyltransferase
MRLPMFAKRLLKEIRCRRTFNRWGEPEMSLDLLPGYRINRGDLVKIGIGVHFGDNIFIDGRGGVTIGSNVIFAPDVSVLSYNHDFRNPKWKPYSPEFILREVKVGDHCWIGKNAILLPGAELGENCVVGAGSVVHGTVPANSVVAGNPARVIGHTHYDDDAAHYQVIHGLLRRFG